MYTVTRYVPDNITHYKITKKTEFLIDEGRITKEEEQWLAENDVLRITGYNVEDGEVSEVEINPGKLSQIAYEYSLLKQVASSVETDILDAFRQSESNILTTAQIAEATDRPKSSVSRALSRLVDDNKITKVQTGVYEYP